MAAIRKLPLTSRAGLFNRRVILSITFAFKCYPAGIALDGRPDE